MRVGQRMCLYVKFMNIAADNYYNYYQRFFPRGFFFIGVAVDGIARRSSNTPK